MLTLKNNMKIKNKTSLFFLSTILITHILFSELLMAKDTPLLTGDLGGSSGINNGTTYQEINLGINLNFTEWLTWRNAGYQRSGSKIKQSTGLDSTLRLVLRSDFSSGSAHLFVGPGYRWASESDNNALIGEAGLGGHFKGLGISGGAKYLKYDKDRFNNDNEKFNNEETSYFVNISGSTSFGK